MTHRDQARRPGTGSIRSFAPHLRGFPLVRALHFPQSRGDSWTMSADPPCSLWCPDACAFVCGWSSWSIGRAGRVHVEVGPESGCVRAWCVGEAVLNSGSWPASWVRSLLVLACLYSPLTLGSKRGLILLRVR